jgi:hypothetical protein
MLIHAAIFNVDALDPLATLGGNCSIEPQIKLLYTSPAKLANLSKITTFCELERCASDRWKVHD